MLNEIKAQYQQGDVTAKIIYWNVFLFVLPLLIEGILALFQIQFMYIHWFSLSSNPLILLEKPWTLITYAFFHFDFFHLLFNMIALHFIGSLFHTYFTQKQFIGVYFLGLIFSGILYMVSYLIFPALLQSVVPMVGASGAIMAVLFATASYAPYMQIRLLLIGHVKLWQIALVFIILDIVQLPYQNTGGHLAHLGGALFGYLYIAQLKRGIDLSTYTISFWEKCIKLFQSKKSKPFVHIHKNQNPIKKATEKTKSQQQTDDILDKISKSGYDSLSKDEKDFLFRKE